MSSTSPPTATVAEVRAILNDAESEVVDDSTIETAISHAEAIAYDVRAPEASDRLVQIAIADVAAWRSLTGTDVGSTQRKEALDAAVQYDVSARLRTLKEQADESLARISEKNRPKLFTVGDRRQRSSRSKSTQSRY